MGNWERPTTTVFGTKAFNLSAEEVSDAAVPILILKHLLLNHLSHIVGLLELVYRGNAVPPGAKTHNGDSENTTRPQDLHDCLLRIEVALLIIGILRSIDAQGVPAVATAVSFGRKNAPDRRVEPASVCRKGRSRIL